MLVRVRCSASWWRRSARRPRRAASTGMADRRRPARAARSSSGGPGLALAMNAALGFAIATVARSQLAGIVVGDRAVLRRGDRRALRAPGVQVVPVHGVVPRSTSPLSGAQRRGAGGGASVVTRSTRTRRSSPSRRGWSWRWSWRPGSRSGRRSAARVAPARTSVRTRACPWIAGRSKRRAAGQAERRAVHARRSPAATWNADGSDSASVRSGWNAPGRASSGQASTVASLSGGRSGPRPPS